ncbi:MAG: NAD(+) synthase [Acidobacteria bacterium]|nr:NAD(+) synthase [Acidobacteriota bacterium]
MAFHRNVLQIDPAAEADRVARWIAEQARALRRKGVVVGLSGGIDSALTLALSVRAVGAEHVVGLILPERESNPVSSRFAAAHARALGVEHREIDITPTVDSVERYAERDAYLRALVPEAVPGSAYNIVLPADLLERDAFSFYLLQVRLPDGGTATRRLGIDEFHKLTAFANIKIRSRMLHLYHEAERRNYLVGGTTNRTELVLGDFCRYGDGGSDVEPLAHLYKDQVYQLARHLDVTREIIERTPSPDTFSLPVSDQEFFFRIPFDKDLLLYAWEHDVPAAEAACVTGIDEAAALRAYRDFTTKNRATAHLRALPPAPR